MQQALSGAMTTGTTQPFTASLPATTPTAPAVAPLNVPTALGSLPPASGAATNALGNGAPQALLPTGVSPLPGMGLGRRP
jgi:hypothetical protein